MFGIKRNSPLDLAYTSLDNNPLAWRYVAEEALVKAAKRSQFITTDDVWEILDTQKPKDKRAIAAIMADGVKDGIISKTNDYKISDKQVSHGRPSTQRIYKSALYRDDEFGETQ